MTKTIGIGICIILLAVAAYVLFAPRPVANSTPETQTSNETSNSSAVRAEENMVVVSEQKPGTTVVGSLIVLKEPGYLVVHEDNNGEPGAILGASALLQAGESSEVKVALSRASKDGEKLHAMLHAEKGGNTTFRASEDTPVQSILGGPLTGWFDIANDAPDYTPVSI